MHFNVQTEDWREKGVYRIVNKINGHVYIGSTTVNFRHRFLQHRSAFLKKSYRQPLLFNALLEFGFENFSFEIICFANKEACIKMEQFYLNQKFEYNACKIAGSLQGLKHSETSKTRTVTGGKHHCSKPVYQFSMKGGFVEKFPSIMDAVRRMGRGKNATSHITQSCIGATCSAFGFRWSFCDKVVHREDFRASQKNIEARANSLYKKVIAIDGSIEYPFNSVKEAAIYWIIKSSNISQVLKGNNKKTFSKKANRYISFKYQKNEK